MCDSSTPLINDLVVRKIEEKDEEWGCVYKYGVNLRDVCFSPHLLMKK
nr:hypothetical protein [Tanacetum cinerariifolium]